MSLEALNQPSLVAASGVAVMAILPALETAITGGTIPFPIVKAMNGILYGLNVFSTSQPGRIDGQISEQEKRTEMDTYSTGARGRTLVSPAPWAFIIWAPIFLGELVFVTSSLFLLNDSSSPVAAVVKKASGGFMVAQIMLSLWAAAFRPKYKGKEVYISAGLLSGIAYSLNHAHRAFATVDSASYDASDYRLYFLPMTLHFAWTTAASLVNWNGSLAAIESSSAKTIAWAGHASAIGATAVGVVVTITRQAPVYGCVIAWALTACGGGMENRIASASGEDPGRAGVYGAKVQMWLCRIGAVIATAAAGFVFLTSKKDSSKSS